MGPLPLPVAAPSFRPLVSPGAAAVAAASVGFYWQLLDSSGAKLNTGINQTASPEQCKAYLEEVCVPSPHTWQRFQM